MNQAFPVLYTFRRCPYAIRARMTLAYAGINFEVREVVLRDKPQEMLMLSPKGTVPVMQLTDGTVLEESLDIMKWALRQSDPDGWNLSNASVRAMIDQLIEENDFSFKPSLDGYKYPRGSPEKTAEEHRDAGAVFLAALERRLQKSDYLLGETISLADVALFPFVRQFAGVDQEWFKSSTFVNLRAWLHFFVEHPLFTRVMQKYPPWRAGDAPVFFNNLSK